MIAARILADLEHVPLEPLPSCTCGGCFGCPDGWHTDWRECDDTADCVLGDEHCPECGYCSVSWDTTGPGVPRALCKVCGFDATAEMPIYQRCVTITPNPAYI